VKIRYLGHSCVELWSRAHALIIDPFLTGNPLAAAKAADVTVDYILVTHGHADHVGDAIEIAERNQATIIAPTDLAQHLARQGAKIHPMDIGGQFRFPFGTVKLTTALHGSSYTPKGSQENYGTGMPAGFLVTIDGKTVYDAGDTGLFSDMYLIGRYRAIDIAFLPIGDNYTMGPGDAVLAAQSLQAKVVVPIHYNTFPEIQQDPHAFVDQLRATGVRGMVMAPGQSIEL
jgi:L-ascorbate metabolism protein UlaG (beta-lactamase superfamily)